MKVLIIRNYPLYSDVKETTYNIQELGLAKALVKKGHKCDILFWTNGTEEDVIVDLGEFGNVKVFYRRGFTLLKNTVFMNSDKLFDEYDILQTCEYNQLQSWILAKKYKKKLVIYHGPYYSKFNKRYNMICKLFDVFCLRRYKNKNTRFLVKSTFAKSFLENKGVKQDNIVVAGVGMDVEQLSSQNPNHKEKITLEMEKDTESLRLLYVGRIEPRRNIIFMFDALNEIVKEHPDTKLYMVGSGSEAYMDEVFGYAEQLGVMDKVIWQKEVKQKNLSEIYSLAHFFLLPTEYEIFGMVLLEAMYFKNIVITTSNGGSSMLVDNDINGIILDAEDASVWSKKILEIYYDNNKFEQLRNNACKIINEHYTWDDRVNVFMDTYSDIIAK